MTDTERRLAEDRATRNAARAVFEANVAQIRADLEARSIPGRIVDKANQEVKSAISEGLAVAREGKGIIAGTIAALLLWLFRDSLLAALDSLFERKPDVAAEPAPVQEVPATVRAKRCKAKEVTE